MTEEQALEVIRRLIAKESQASIARALKAPVTMAMVNHISNGNSWKHLWSTFGLDVPRPYFMKGA